MATQTRNKPSATSNRTGTTTYTQSQELVKTLIFVSASVVTIARSIFSERHYAKRKFDPAEMKETFSFAGFLDQKPVVEEVAYRERTDRGVWTLNRGSSPTADKFLDMLDQYVFEGIRLKALEAFEFEIYEDPQRRDQVLERWTFQISYPDGATDPQLGIQLHRLGQQTVKITDAQDRLRETIRSIGLLANDMIHLPYERHLGIVLQYRDDCDSQHIHVEDTEPCEADVVRFPSAEYYDVQSSRLRGYSDGKHEVQVSTTYVNAILTDEVIAKNEVAPPIKKYEDQGVKNSQGGQTGGQYVESSQPPQQHMHSPQSLGGLGSPSVSRHGSQHLSGDADIDMSYDERPQSFKGSPGHSNVRAEAEAQYNSSSLTAAQGQQLMRSQDDQDSLSTPDQQASLGMSQQSRMSVQSVDNGVTQRLRGMVQTVRQSDEIVSNTQLRVEQSEMPPPRRVGSDMLPTQDTGAGPGVDPEIHTRPLRYSDDTLELLERRKPSVQESATRATRSKLRASQSNNSHDVRCECKTMQEDSDMLECHCCEKRQHIRCYGYHGVDDLRIANPHACYTCLVGEKDKRLLRNLEHLAQYRRVISLGQSADLLSIALLKSRLGMNAKTAQETLNAMENEGLLELKASTGSTRKTAKEWTLTVESEQGLVANAAREVFDPTAHIAHLFDEGSMAPIGPLRSPYGAMATDPLVRSSSIGNMSRLGRSFPDLLAVVNNAHDNGQSSREGSSIMNPPQRAVEVPRTPTSSQQKRRRIAAQPAEGQQIGKRRRLMNPIYVPPSPLTRSDENDDNDGDEPMTEV